MTGSSGTGFAPVVPAAGGAARAEPGGGVGVAAGAGDVVTTGLPECGITPVADAGMGFGGRGAGGGVAPTATGLGG